MRQAKYLSRHFPVTVIGYGHLGALHDSGVEMAPVRQAGGAVRRVRSAAILPLGKLLHAIAYEKWYWGKREYRTCLDLLRSLRPSLIHANDWMALPVAAAAAQSTETRIVLDLHEYSPLEAENRLYWRWFYRPMIDYFLRRYALQAEAFITVGAAIANKYAQEYGFRPCVIMNTPESGDTPAFRPVDPDHIRLIHHGAAARDRKLELMVHALAASDQRYTLDFMLMEASTGYINELRVLAERIAPGRINFRDPVPPGEIVGRIAEYDMGLYLLPFTNFNHSMALPNKFFDFVMAGLAVLIGPSPEMARLTHEHGFGRVAPSFAPRAAAEVLNRLSSLDINHMKMRALAARKSLNAEVEMGKLVNLYGRLMEEHHAQHI